MADDKIDSGDYTPADKYRRAIALALLGQGFGKHGRAGGIGVAADAVNGLVGGYMLRGADMDEKESNSKVAALLAQQPGFSSGTTAPVVPPSTQSVASVPPGDVAPVPGGEPVMIGHDSGSSRPGSSFNPYTVRVGEPGAPGGAPIVDRGTGKHAVDYNKNGFGLAYDAPVGSMPSPAVISQLQKEVEAENFRRGNLTPMPFRGHGEADLLHKTGQDPRRATATSRDLTEASWRPYATALHDRSQIGVDPTGSDVRFNYDPASGANNINQFGGAQAPIRVAQAGPTGSLPVAQRGITAAAGMQPDGAQTAQAPPTPQPAPQGPPASQPGAQAGPSADQVAYYQKLVAEAKRTGNPKITQMAMQYRAQVEAQLQKAGTDDIKEYERAQRDPAFKQYLLDIKRAGATSITNAPDFRGEVAESKARGEVVGKAAGEREVAYENVDAKAHTKLGTIAIMRQGMKDPDFFSGGGIIGDTLAPAWKRMQVLMGGDPNAAASVETFGALSKQMALEKMGGSLGTGFSNADRDFVVGQVPGLANTRAGNAALLDVTERIEKRNIEVGRMYRAWKKENKGAAINDFKEYMMDWEERNPVFSPDDPIFKAAGEEAAAPKGAGKFSNPAMKPGEWQTLPDGTQVRKRPK